MRMSKLKDELFPDYGFLNRCVQAQNEAIKTRSRPPTILNLFEKKEDDEKDLQADNKLIPLSYSGICDPYQTIVNKETNGFIENF